MVRKITSCVVIGMLGSAATAVAQVAEKASGSTSPTPMIDELRAKNLLIPVLGVKADQLKDTFRHARVGNRTHYAIDIVAKRGTPVVSADSGRIVKLFKSQAGGVTVYASDPGEKYLYYYAHLDRYRPGVSEGMVLSRGDTIGYVGTTGNAPSNYPHLHFAIMRSYNIKRWSRGTPINPAKVFYE